MLDKEEIKLEICKLFEALGIFDIESQESKLEEEMDSLQFISLICDLEDKYGISFLDEELLIDNYKDTREFVDFVTEKILKLNNQENTTL